MIVYEETRNEIIAKYLSGKKIKELSDEYGIPYSHVISICKNFSNNSEKYGIKKTCESCGKEFIGKKTSKYCSKECSIVIRKLSAHCAEMSLLLKVRKRCTVPESVPIKVLNENTRSLSPQNKLSQN